jgi:hypothetical protein
MWSQDFPERDQAFAAERQIKGWSRAKKEALIAGDYDLLRTLSRRILRDEASASSASPQDERVVEGSDIGARLIPHPVIVLVRPQLGENIGKAARAMLNFGLTEMRLVSPRDGWPNPAAGPASSGADSVLEQAKRVRKRRRRRRRLPHVFRHHRAQARRDQAGRRRPTRRPRDPRRPRAIGDPVRARAVGAGDRRRRNRAHDPHRADQPRIRLAQPRPGGDPRRL